NVLGASDDADPEGQRHHGGRAGAARCGGKPGHGRQNRGDVLLGDLPWRRIQTLDDQQPGVRHRRDGGSRRGAWRPCRNRRAPRQRDHAGEREQPRGDRGHVGPDPRFHHKEILGGSYEVDACVIRDAATAAPNPLSMLTTVTPEAQLFSAASNAATPPKLAPYPTLVGTAITGLATRPPTTDGNAPSIPATTITTAALVSACAPESTR